MGMKDQKSEGLEKKEQTAGKPAEEGGDEACRCKETAAMKPRDLLKLMISDLAFWKKEKQ
jgi:hypothetical protein